MQLDLWHWDWDSQQVSEPSTLTLDRLVCTSAAEEEKSLQNSRGKLALQHSSLPALLQIKSKNQKQGITHPRDRLWILGCCTAARKRCSRNVTRSNRCYLDYRCVRNKHSQMFLRRDTALRKQEWTHFPPRLCSPKNLAPCISGISRHCSFIFKNLDASFCNISISNCTSGNNMTT